MLEKIIERCCTDIQPPPYVEYLKNRIVITCYNTITYPSPMQKFTVIVDPNSQLSYLEDMFVLEFGKKRNVEVLFRGKMLSSYGGSTRFGDLDFKKHNKLIIREQFSSRTFPSPEEHKMMNRHYVGEVLFGQSNKMEVPLARNLKFSRGLELLSLILENIFHRRVVQAIARHEQAKLHEAQLYAMLEEESKVSR